jgi:hypothetical protein
MAICEQCEAAFSIRHSRRSRYRPDFCPICCSNLLPAVLIPEGNRDGHALYAAMEKPELKVPAIWNIVPSFSPAQLPQPIIARGVA